MRQILNVFTAQASTPVSDSFSVPGLNPIVDKFGATTSFSDILNTLMPLMLTGAGLILFAMLIMGGFDMLLGASDAKKVEAGKARITAALTGFIIIFAAYWIVQILQVLLGISILK